MVQIFVSLTSSLVVKMLTVLASTISNSDIFAEKMGVAYANAKATHIVFSKNISICAIFNDKNLKDTFTNDIVIFEHLGPEGMFSNVDAHMVPLSDLYRYCSHRTRQHRLSRRHSFITCSISYTFTVLALCRLNHQASDIFFILHRK